MRDILPRRVWPLLSTILWVVSFVAIGNAEVNASESSTIGLLVIGIAIMVLIIGLPALVLSLISLAKPINSVATAQSILLVVASGFIVFSGLNAGDEGWWWYLPLFAPALLPLLARHSAPKAAPVDTETGAQG